MGLKVKKVDPEVFGEINPTEYRRACAAVEQKLRDFPETKGLRPKKWQLRVEMLSGERLDQFLANCVLRREGEEWCIEVTGLRRSKPGGGAIPLLRPPRSL
jgi:hypothetical protein